MRYPELKGNIIVLREKSIMGQTQATNFLHCIAKQHNGYWSARCLDFTLYAVGNSFEEAKEKLDAQITEYLYDATEGEDRAFAPQLLMRRAPWRDWLEYYAIAAVLRFSWLKRVTWATLIDLTLPSPPYRHA